MRTVILIMIFSIIAATMTSAQQEDKGRMEEKIESQMIAYLTSSLNLTPTEAQQFWPVHNAYRAEHKALRSEMKKDKNKEDISLDDLLNYEQKQIDLKKSYAAKFSDTIGEKRTVKLLRSERRFKEKMIKGLKEKRSGKKRERG